MMKKTTAFSKIGIVLMCSLLAAACSSAGADTTNLQAPAAETATAGTESGENPAASADPQAALDAAAKAEYDEDDLTAEWTASGSTAIALNGTSATVDGAGASVSGGTVTIAQAGVYVVSGTLTDGQLVVDVTKDETVRLVLNGAQIHSGTSAPIYVKEADKVIITLADGTENIVSDAESYVYPDAAVDEPSSAIFSKGDLTFNGDGALTVIGNYNDGINGRDDLKIVSGTLKVQAADDGIVGKDMVAIRGGNIAIEAEGDGIKSTNDSDAARGFVAIAGGSFNIAAGNDGIQAETSLVVEDGSFVLRTGGGYENGEVKTEQFGGFGERPGRQTAAATAAVETDTPSMKGLKAGAALIVSGGSFAIDSADDAIHSNGTVTIAGGQIEIATGDDGIHADGEVAITGGVINITNSYEGVEGAVIVIAGGELHIVASDDGINAAGNDGLNNRLVVSGGYTVVNAQGDGLDANGHIEMSGGTVIVNGPTGSGNGALDYDGSFDISGGTLIAAGSAGMAQATSESSAQPAVSMTFAQTQQAGTLIRLADSDGNEIAAFAPSKSYQSVVISSPELKQGKSYTLYTGGSSTGSGKDGLYTGGSYTGGTEVVSFEIADSVTWLNESGVTTGGGNMGFGGGMGGRPGGAGGGGGPREGVGAGGPGVGMDGAAGRARGPGVGMEGAAGGM